MFLSGSLLRGLLALTLAVLPSVQAYVDPQPCSGECRAHDPSIIKRSSDGTYFRFNTGSQIGIFTSTSLSGPWAYKGSAISSKTGSKIDLTGRTDLWAPEVHLIGDTYYLYYTVSSFGTQASAIGYATSMTMDVGSWTDFGSTGVVSVSGDNFNALDPNLIQVDSTWYMNFGSFWQDIFQVQMNSPPTKATGSHTNIAFNASGEHAMEGAFMYYKSPYYYLFFSSGACCGYDTKKPAAGEEYAVHVCRSDSVSGPFTDADGVSCTAGGGTTVLASHENVYGPGGQGIMDDSTHGTVIYYHYADTTIGIADGQYQFGWNTLSFSTGWPVAT